jgi:hypothetical protein
MGQMHQVSLQLVLLLVGLVPVVPAAAAQAYCSLTVRVLYPDGQEADALVSVEENSGRVAKQRLQSGEVRFCDLGAFPVTVKVGVDGMCNQVVVRNVPVGWNKSKSLTVTYDVDACLIETPPPPSPVCRTVFRIADASGNWVSTASIRLSNPTLSVLGVDEFGRSSILSRAGDQIAGLVEAPGYEPQSFHLSCPESQPVREEHIRLRAKHSAGNSSRSPEPLKPEQR